MNTNLKILSILAIFIIWGATYTILFPNPPQVIESPTSPPTLVTITVVTNSTKENIVTRVSNTNNNDYDNDQQPHKIALIIPWRGKFPVWMNFFLESVKINSIYNFIFILDRDDNGSIPIIPQLPLISNVHYYIFEGNITWAQYFSHKLHDYAGIDSNTSRLYFYEKLYSDPYLVTKLRPMFGMVFKDILKGYTHWGWTDLDLIYGNLGHIVSSDDLRTYDVVTLSFDDNSAYIRGQFTILKNSEKCNNLFAGVDGWNVLPKVEDFDYEEGCFSSRVIRDSTVSVKMIPAQFTEFDFTKKVGADKYTDSYFYGLFWKNEYMKTQKKAKKETVYVPITNNCSMLFWIRDYCRNCGIPDNAVYETRGKETNTYLYYDTATTNTRELAFFHFQWKKKNVTFLNNISPDKRLWKLTSGEYGITFDTNEY